MDNKRQIKHDGEIMLGDNIIPCYILEDGTRVLSGRGMQEALKMVDKKETSGTRLQRYFNQKSLEPFIYADKEPVHYDPIICYNGNQKIHGYEATILADICEAFLKARDSIALSPRQKIIADQCEILMRGFARVGIIALIDEATGYQYERERIELQKILSTYVSEEVLKWQKTFDIEFYKELFRLWDIPFIPKYIKRKPRFVGRLTTSFVYKQLPYGEQLTEELKHKSQRNQDGNYKYRFHQSLTPEIGREALKKQIYEVTTLMNISDTKEQFQRLFEKKYSEHFQPTFFEIEEEEEKPPSKFDKSIQKIVNTDYKD